MDVKQLPERKDVKPEDTWDLTSLFASDDAWEQEFKKYQKQISKVESFKGTLSTVDAILDLYKFLDKINRMGERLGNYAFLKTAQDAGDGEAMDRQGRFISAAVKASAATSFIEPEILSLSAAKFKAIVADPKLKKYALALNRIWRYKPHTLSQSEEKLLAMQGEMAGSASKIFDQLTDVDMRFGVIKDHQGQKIELSHATFSALLHGPKRAVRKQAFEQYYKTFDEHAHTVAATLEASIQKDVYYAKARNFPSAREMALFNEFIPVSVFDSLVESINRHLPTLYKYYAIRQRAMKLPDLHMYDTYVPIVQGLDVHRTWKEAVDLVSQAVAPLGDEYVSIITRGLTTERWCDKFENRGKSSGAFSCGAFDGFPYILMNYQESVLDHVFTLAHEGGHSMHSYYSCHTQPFTYHDYELFVAEVASTFNEQLLHHLLFSQAGNDKKLKAYLINRQIDAMKATIFRQTMFAEFERDAHAAAEAGQSLTLDLFRKIYRVLLDKYFGPDFVVDDLLELECLRIPHFYRAFYVYKYATGMSAAIALSNRVLNGGVKERNDYLGFLKGGCSKEPLELLKGAGVDMSTPAPVDSAMEYFATLVNELDELTK